MDSPNLRLALSQNRGIGIEPGRGNRDSKITSESLGGKNAGRTMVPTFAAEITPFGFSPPNGYIGHQSTTRNQDLRHLRYPRPPFSFRQVWSIRRTPNMKEAGKRRPRSSWCLCGLQWQIWTEQVLPEIDPNKNLEIRYNLSEVRPFAREDKDALHKRTRDDFTANLIDRKTARIETGREASPGDENVYAYMLKPVMSRLVSPAGQRMQRKRVRLLKMAANNVPLPHALPMPNSLFKQAAQPSTFGPNPDAFTVLMAEVMRKCRKILRMLAANGSVPNWADAMIQALLKYHTQAHYLGPLSGISKCSFGGQ